MVYTRTTCVAKRFSSFLLPYAHNQTTCRHTQAVNNSTRIRKDVRNEPIVTGKRVCEKGGSEEGGGGWSGGCHKVSDQTSSKSVPRRRSDRPLFGTDLRCLSAFRGALLSFRLFA